MADSDLEQRIVDGQLWRDFCDELKEAGEVLLRGSTPASVFDRAEGIRYLTRLLRAGLESQLEFGNPNFPGFYQLSNETIKIGNDNPDNDYQNTTISGRHEYRITGTRGTAPYLSFGTKAGGYETTGDMVPTGQIEAAEMDIDSDGSFELRVSCEKKPGNWLPMQPETTSLIVRQTFLDRASEEPARLEIECLDPDGDNRLTPEFLERKLSGALHFMKNTANIFVDWMEIYSKHKNELPSDDQERCQRAGGDALIHYLQSYWDLAEDEALRVHARTIPKCSSWNLQLSNFWMESLDYRYHKVHVNKDTAVYESDGSCVIVIAHEDPGPRYPNWLTTTGHRRGGMLFRWIEADSHPPVETRVLKFREL